MLSKAQRTHSFCLLSPLLFVGLALSQTTTFYSDRWSQHHASSLDVTHHYPGIMHHHPGPSGLLCFCLYSESRSNLIEFRRGLAYYWKFRKLTPAPIPNCKNFIISLAIFQENFHYPQSFTRRTVFRRTLIVPLKFLFRPWNNPQLLPCPPNHQPIASFTLTLRSSSKPSLPVKLSKLSLRSAFSTLPVLLASQWKNW